MSFSSPCIWRHVTGEIIPCAVRWYLHDSLSYCDVEELWRERRLTRVITVDKNAAYPTMLLGQYPFNS